MCISLDVIYSTYYCIVDAPMDLNLIHESPHVPANENMTDTNFTLPPLDPEEEFVIMPTTFAEGKVGSFILSVIADCEFTLAHMKQ